MTRFRVPEAVSPEGAKGVDQSWISKVERGVRRLDVIELSKFARLYGRPARYFVPEFPPE